MTKENLMDALNGIDFDMVEDAERETPRSGKRWIPWTAAAALAAVVALSLGLRNHPGQDTSINPTQNVPPVISYVNGGQALTGKQEVVFGKKVGMSNTMADIALPDFYVGTVLEVQVLEVLPDTYYDLNERKQVHVAKLRVLDQINADGFPDEIWLQYSYYDNQILEGYDSFILSVYQQGVENYMILNQNQSRVDYFSDMFTTGFCLGYGSVIAFRDGRVEESFWDTTKMKCPDYFYEVPGSEYFFDPKLDYPASAGSTAGEVKENILKKDSGRGGKYITAEDIFTEEGSEELKEYLSIESGNVFLQYLQDVDHPSIKYTRVVNGFLTDEVITVGDTVTTKGSAYTPEDLTAMPDIGQALGQLDLAELVPPHVEVTEDMILRYATATGTYRKVGNALYGIVKVVWFYGHTEEINRFVLDDCYFLYDAGCNGRVVGREELRAIIGDDTLIAEFSYNPFLVFF